MLDTHLRDGGEPRAHRDADGPACASGTWSVAPATTAEHLLLLLGAYGVEHLFLNPGTDSAPIQEAVFSLAKSGAPIPVVVGSSFESVALSAAHGYFEVTGRPQCVFVHVDAGTQNLGAMLHNAYRDAAGVVIIAGRTPYGEDKGALGGRSSPIHWQQDIADQPGIVRGYTKWALEVVDPGVLSRAVGRAVQLATSSPAGPCYLTISRDVLMKPPDLVSGRVGRFAVPSRPALDARALQALGDEVARSERALLITSRAGRSPEAFAALGVLAERAGIWVAEGGESRSLNVATDHRWRVRSAGALEAALGSADLVLVVDCDVPWVPMHVEPAADARVLQIDPEPTKVSMPLWSFPVDLSFEADGATALAQLLAAVERADEHDHALAEACERRRTRRRQGPWFGERIARPEQPDPAHAESGRGVLPEEVMAGLNAVLGPEDLVVEEAVTNRGAVREHLVRTRAGTLYGAGAPGLGWALGGALGVKLASPQRRVVSICGDGSFLFAIPTSALVMAAELQSPFLVVVLNNRGYRASRLPVYELFPEGHSVAAGTAVGTRFDMPPDFATLATACHAHGERVETSEELAGALERALAALDAGRVALVDVLVDQD
jgi:acetolactate synthase I/II/III large subunit